MQSPPDPDSHPDWRAERIAKNEASFRLINDRLEAGMRRVAETPELIPFICECGSRSCTDVVELSIEEYEAVRAHPDRFAVLPDHVFPEVETVVARHDRYVVVEKLGLAGKISELTDPRGDDPIDPRQLA
jgi:hypothetical protein